MYESYSEELNSLVSASSLRSIKPIDKEGKYIYLEGKRYLNLSSNDYLGLAENKDIFNEFLKNADYSLGSASARLLTGTSPVYKELEEYLAKIYGKESALLFNSGYHANVGIFSSLVSKGDVIFSDKLNHASVIDGMRLSGGDFYRYKHLDYEHLETLLEKHRESYNNAIIVTESIFSMDGDCADLNKLVDLKYKYNCILIVDEAHAFGVLGEGALGLCEVQNCIADVDLIIATFGKAIGSVGAFCCSSNILINYLINKARSFIFSTSLPELNIAYTLYILKNIIPDTKVLRKQLILTSNSLRQSFLDLSINTVGETHIVPIIIGDNELALKVSTFMQENEFYILPIRYPTVSRNSARIRISMRADITPGNIKKIPVLINAALNK